MTRADDAVACFDRGYNCAQAVLSSCSEQYGMSKEDAYKVAGAFGAGMGRMAGTCGAVTGAYMVIGLKYGMWREGDQAAKEKAYALAQEFARRFAEKNCSTVCRELLGHDMSTPAGFQAIKEKKLTTTACPKYVRDAAEIVSDILDRQV